MSWSNNLININSNSFILFKGIPPILEYLTLLKTKSSLILTEIIKDIIKNKKTLSLFNEKFEVGATYRFEDSFGAMINYAITPSLRIGYAYDHIVSDLNVTTPSSHEFMLLFDLNFSKKVSQSPRYF